MSCIEGTLKEFQDRHHLDRIEKTQNERKRGKKTRFLQRLELLLHFHCIPCSLSHHRVLSSFRVSFLFFRVTNVSHPSFDGLSDPFYLSSHSSFFLLMRPLVLFDLCNQYSFVENFVPFSTTEGISCLPRPSSLNSQKDQSIAHSFNTFVESIMLNGDFYG